jgi:hypothetical protein
MIANLTTHCSRSLLSISVLPSKICFTNVRLNSVKFAQNLHTTRIIPFLPKPAATRQISQQAIKDRHWVVNPVDKKLVQLSTLHSLTKKGLPRYNCTHSS